MQLAMGWREKEDKEKMHMHARVSHARASEREHERKKGKWPAVNVGRGETVSRMLTSRKFFKLEHCSNNNLKQQATTLTTPGPRSNALITCVTARTALAPSKNEGKETARTTRQSLATAGNTRRDTLQIG